MNPTAYVQPENGAFLVATCALSAVVGLDKKAKRFELPGGGEESSDNKSLLTTAIREAKQECAIKVLPKNTISFAKLGQKVRRGDTFQEIGTLELVTTQIFSIGEQHRFVTDKTTGWKILQDAITAENVTTEDSDLVALVPLKQLLNDANGLNLPLSHKRMILHYLNYTKAIGAGKMKIGDLITGRIGDPVTAYLPGIGGTGERFTL